MTCIPAGQTCHALSYLVRVTIDPGSPEPAYVQLAALLRTRIHAGEFSSRPLPSNRALRQEYDLGEFAVSHALRVLVEDGLIYSVPRRGYFVRRDASKT
jgi:GntR family transcriptional regulator